jgi:hypothetical protein
VRRSELREAFTTWEQQGHAASLVTITVPHDLDDPLAKLVDAERAAWKHVTQGAAWQRLKRKLGIAGHVIALEFTWGDQNGWHPHYHVLRSTIRTSTPPLSRGCTPTSTQGSPSPAATPGCASPISCTPSASTRTSPPLRPAPTSPKAVAGPPPRR